MGQGFLKLINLYFTVVSFHYSAFSISRIRTSVLCVTVSDMLSVSVLKFLTGSQALARIADNIVSQQPLIISDCC